MTLFLLGALLLFLLSTSPTTDATFLKSVREIPYNTSINQIRHLLSNPEAEAPVSAPEVQDITSIMSTHGCKVFSDTLKTFPDALTVYNNNLQGGLTVFCPTDNALNNFFPKFKNLTKDDKISLLLFHGVPIYYSMSMLKSGNGVFNTLATDGQKKFDFTVQNDGKAVTLKTEIVKASITDTIFDKDPVAVFALDKVLKPEEIFASEIPPAPSPAPEKIPSRKKHKGVAAPPKPRDDGGSPADAPAADDTAADKDKNGGGERKRGVWIVGVSVGFWVIISMLV